MRQNKTALCKFFNTPKGCFKGNDCPFKHIKQPAYPLRSPHPLIDIGLNFGHRQFSRDRPQIIKNAISANVEAFIITGTSEKASEYALSLCETYKKEMKMYCTVGVHPHDAKTCNENTIATLTNLAKSNHVVAIGECGLDFDRNFSKPEIQIKWFEEQLKLASKLNKPVFLHERSAHTEFLKIMSKFPNIKACVHCFTGTKAELEEYLKRGYYIGITGFICNDARGKELQQIVRLVPLNRLMVETDAPFMTPKNMKSPFDRVKRNEPAFLPVVVQKIAECMKKSFEEVAIETRKTTMEFFGLK